MKRRNKEERRIAAIQKELGAIKREEEKLLKAAVRRNTAGAPLSQWKEALEKKIPGQVEEKLKAAFIKAFVMIFEKGTSVIEKSYKKEEIQDNYRIKNYAVEVKSRRRELRSLKKGARAANLGNLALTAVEGVGLGALGIGLPDIVLFVGMVLKGVYETSLHYGYDYERPQERYLILKLLEASLAKGEEWNRLNEEIDSWLESGVFPEPEEDVIKMQIEKTAGRFALDMLFLKFVQGIPIAGIAAGVGNPIYYRKVMQYIQLKYQKRYLYDLYHKALGKTRRT